MAGEGRTDRPNYKASSHRLRSSMRNDRQGRRIEIEGKEDCERGGDRPGRSWLRRQGAPSRHYPLTGNYPSSGRLAEGARARARAYVVYSFSLFPLYLLSTLPSPPPPLSSSLFSCRKNRGAESPLPLFSGQRARGRSDARKLRGNKGTAIGAATPRTEAG